MKKFIYLLIGLGLFLGCNTLEDPNKLSIKAKNGNNETKKIEFLIQYSIIDSLKIDKDILRRMAKTAADWNVKNKLTYDFREGGTNFISISKYMDEDPTFSVSVKGSAENRYGVAREITTTAYFDFETKKLIRDEDYNTDNILISKTTYKDDQKDGTIAYSWDGKLHTKGNYKNGKKDGLWVQYFWGELLDANGTYYNGISRSTNWKDGKEDGLKKGYVSYCNEIILLYIYNSKKGVLDGPFETYYDLSELLFSEADDFDCSLHPYEFNEIYNLAERGTYKDGKLDGPLEKYYGNGQLEDTFIYEEGVLILTEKQKEEKQKQKEEKQRHNKTKTDCGDKSSIEGKMKEMDRDIIEFSEIGKRKYYIRYVSWRTGSAVNGTEILDYNNTPCRD